MHTFPEIVTMVCSARFQYKPLVGYVSVKHNVPEHTFATGIT